MATNDKKRKKDEHLPPMPKTIREELLKLVNVQSHSTQEHRMHYYVTRWLDRRNIRWKYDHTGNILAIKGRAETYPCIVSHLDTVHQIQKYFKVYKKFDTDEHEIWFAQNGNHPTGIGGDDKCGIFACFKMLERFDNIKAVFFTKEEAGLIGSGDIDLDWFDDVGYVIQLDRFGRSDFICRDYSDNTVSQEFLSKIEKNLSEFGYTETTGLITDSINLAHRGVGISCVNVSCGYYQHHTAQETIDLNELNNAILFTESIIEVLGEEKYKKEFLEYKVFADRDEICPHCGRKSSYYVSECPFCFTSKIGEKENEAYCPYCFAELYGNMTYCDQCNSTIEFYDIHWKGSEKQGYGNMEIEEDRYSNIESFGVKAKHVMNSKVVDYQVLESIVKRYGYNNAFDETMEAKDIYEMEDEYELQTGMPITIDRKHMISPNLPKIKDLYKDE